MIDINLLRTNPDIVRENIKAKFQDHKLPLVDEVIKLDAEYRALKSEGDELRQKRNSTSGQIGGLMREKKVEEANALKANVSAINDRIKEIEVKEEELSKDIKTKMMTIPNIIDKSVPIGKDDSENMENQLYRIMKSHIMQIFLIVSVPLTKIVQVEPVVMDSTSY